jgi:hypothetical protein
MTLSSKSRDSERVAGRSVSRFSSLCGGFYPQSLGSVYWTLNMTQNAND